MVCQNNEYHSKLDNTSQVADVKRWCFFKESSIGHEKQKSAKWAQNGLENVFQSSETETGLDVANFDKRCMRT